MKIGIIIHSATGNTYAVAQKLQQKLIAAGYEAEIEKLESSGGEQTDKNKIRLEKIPEIEKYDAFVFGGPVRGFSISPVLSAFLNEVKNFHGKKAACMVTQSFSSPRLGGNRTIKQIQELCESKGAKIIETGIVNWNNPRRESMIYDVVEKISKSFK